MGELIKSGAPAAEPVDLSDIRAALRSDADADDAYVAGLIEAARALVEARIRTPIVNRAWIYYLDAWPSGDEIRLPDIPVAAVDGVGVEGADGIVTATPPGAAVYDADRARVRLDPALLPDLAADERVRIDFQAGFGATPADIPQDLRQAVRLLVAHWYERREIVEDAGAPMPYGVDALLAPYRGVRL